MSVHPGIRIRLGFESGFELAMESFNHAVSLRVVSCCSSMFGTDERHEVVQEVGFELVSMIRDDGRGNTKTRNPPTEEGLSHSFSHAGGEGNGFRPASVAVNAGEEVGESLEWW